MSPSEQITTSYYQPFQGEGKKITCVFENPTWLEELHQRPVAGVAGSRLCGLFKILRHMDCQLTKDLKTQLFRRRVCIVNGVRKVSSVSIKRKDYLSLIDDNQKTLRCAISNADMIICFGGRAEMALKKVDAGVKYAKTYHLCGRAFNRLVNLSGLGESYGLPESHLGLVGLIVIAEYLATWYQQWKSGKEYISFAKFAKPFQRTRGKVGSGRYVTGHKMRKIDISALLNLNGCSLNCCQSCCNCH